LDAKGTADPGSDARTRYIAPLLACAVPLLLLSSAIRIEMNSLGLYARGFRIYGVEEVTGVAGHQLTQAAARLIHFFNSLTDSPQMPISPLNGPAISLYHDYELIHLADVKVLFAANSVAQSFSLLLVVALVIAGLSFDHRADVVSGLRRGALVTLSLLTLVALSFFLDFQQMFVLFHEVAFSNPFWLLDPRTDYLVMLFPLGFWQDMFFIAGASTGLGAAAIYALTTVAARTSRRQQGAGPLPTTETRVV
jgi:integral membrane protein (TIGR01906 family)